MNLESAISELYRKTATQLPDDVIQELRMCLEREKKDSLAYQTLLTILKNAELARNTVRPMCQDTGTPIFFVKYGPNFRQKELREIIEQATVRATSEIPLRPNTTDILSGENSGDNLGLGIPVLYFEERDEKGVEMGLLLKGGGCENISMTYTLPSMKLGAERDLDGVRRCVLDSAVRAQGQGCPPMIVSVVSGSPEDLIAVTAKRQLLRTVGSKNPVPALAKFEKRLTEEINSLGIGPGGFGGNSTVMATFVSMIGRHPASFFVHVTYFCWAARRGILFWNDNKASYAS